MAKSVRDIVEGLITGDDNTSMQPAYFWGAIEVVVGLGLEIWAVLGGHHFDLQQYATGAGILLLAVEGGKRIGQ